MTRRGTRGARSSATHTTMKTGDIAAAVAALAACSHLPQAAGVGLPQPPRSRGVWSPDASPPDLKVDAAGIPSPHSTACLPDDASKQTSNVTHMSVTGVNGGNDTVSALLADEATAELAAALTKPSQDGGAAVASYLQCCDGGLLPAPAAEAPPPLRQGPGPVADDKATDAAGARHVSLEDVDDTSSTGVPCPAGAAPQQRFDYRRHPSFRGPQHQMRGSWPCYPPPVAWQQPSTVTVYTT